MSRVCAATVSAAGRGDTLAVKRGGTRFPLTAPTREDTTINFSNLGQVNAGFLTGPQLSAAVVAQGTGFWSSANIYQANYGIGSGPQTNVAVVSQGH